ncbi:terminase large subunit domain-containing protein, partial [Fructobacillus fructosus]|uniref:terminase large subunit domain-containing protein n=1 Tax=Fructobacillus fructosus TaxID=1631 RepID=UPI0040332405
MKKIDLTVSHDVDETFKQLNVAEIRSKYADEGTKYALNVLDGKEQAGYLMKLACFRHIRDLQRQEQDDFPFIYDLKKTDQILKFAAMCPNVDTGEPTELMPWQRFIMTQLIGWRDLNGGKRFSRAIVSVARGQGKTYLMAILMAYSFLIESLGLENQDFLVSSINYKQTKKLFGYVSTMLKSLAKSSMFKKLAENVELSVQSDQVIMKGPNNVIRAISHESGQYDSYHFTTAIVDEIGEITSRERISKIVSGQVKVKNRQFVQISTAYPNPNVPFHDDQRMVQQAMEQDWKRDADTYLGLIWAQDSLEETFRPET